MLRTLPIAVLAATLTPLDAQTEQAGTMLAPIVRTEHADAGVIRIVYDLRGATGPLVSVVLEASNDGGRTFAIRPRTITGDVGPAVTPGSTRTIVWDTTKDVEDLQIDRFVFRVVVSPGGQPAPTSSGAPRPAAPTSGPGAMTPPAGAEPAAVVSGAKKGGGLSKGALIALAGGGAAAGVGVAASKGKGGSSAAASTPPPSTSSTQQTRTFVGPYSASFSSTVTNPAGSIVCGYALVFAGDLSMTLTTIAAPVTGIATFRGTMTRVASTCDNGTSGPEPTNLGNIQVTGTPGSLSFSALLVGENGGQPTGLTLTFSFAGTLNTDLVTGSLTIVHRSVAPSGLVANGTANVSVTLR